MPAGTQAAARGDSAQVSLLTLLETEWVLRGGAKVGWAEVVGLFTQQSRI